ncbi:mammalian cell entry protein [Mycobacterium sp. CBMA 234]|nr:mammalian cell entry protein [Mycolicibacterium sp. CBMA 234]
MQVGTMFRRITRLLRPAESDSRIRLGAAGLLVIGVLLATVVTVSNLDLGATRYRAYFVQAAGIATGNQVTIAGIPVGAVKQVALAGNRVAVTFTVKNDIALGIDTHAAVKLTTILGSRYLALVPAGSGQLPRHTIELTHTEVPFDLQKTLAGATNTLGPLDAQRIVDSVKTMNTSLQGLPDALPQALANLSSLSAIIAARRDQLGTLLTNTDTVASLLQQQNADLGTLVMQGNQILGEIAARRASMQRLFDGANLLVDRAHTILRDEPQLDALITNVHDFARMMGDHDALVRDILQTAPITVRNLANATGSGNAIDLNVPAGLLVDSWMCALSGRARQFNLVEYFKDCK